jgi:excisionase family DNA binding protein
VNSIGFISFLAFSVDSRSTDHGQLGVGSLQLVSVANREMRVAINERKIILTAREAADYLRISLFTLSRIEREGLLSPFRTPGGHRRYSLEMLNRYLEENQSPARSYQQT